MTTLDYFPRRRADLRSGDDTAAEAHPRDRIVQLIAQYPHISGAEAAEIMRYLRSARYAEIARLTSDESVRNQLDHFIRTHKHEIQGSAIDWIAAIALAIGFIASLWLLWSFTV
jgi:hypothetical protein